MDMYKFNTVEPVGRARAAKRLDEQSVPQNTESISEEVALSSPENTQEMLEELSKRLSHIEISDDSKVFLMFDNGEEFQLNISKLDENKDDKK